MIKIKKSATADTRTCDFANTDYDLSPDDELFNREMDRLCAKGDFVMRAGFQRGWLSARLNPAVEEQVPRGEKIDPETGERETSPQQIIEAYDVLRARIAELEADSKELAKWKKEDSFVTLATVRFLQSLVRSICDEIKPITNDRDLCYDQIRQLRADLQRVQEERDARQSKIGAWCIECFGEAEATSLPQRGMRLLEEASEAAQATGMTLNHALKVVGYVWGRPAGDLRQELGGVAVTTLALAAAAGFSANDAEIAETNRIFNQPTTHFARRNQEKNDVGLLALNPKPTPDEQSPIRATTRAAQEEK